MALIKCPECQTEVSSLATACPKCAAPIAQIAAAKAVGQQVTTTERTSKRIKKHALLSALLLIFGFIMVIGAGESNGMRTIGALIAAVGLVWFLTTRVRGWWHHG
jgi:L-lactate permease